MSVCLSVDKGRAASSRRTKKRGEKAGVIMAYKIIIKGKESIMTIGRREVQKE